MPDSDELSTHEIGRRLRLARERAKIRQEDAAKAIGISRPTLVNIEQGERSLHIRELQTLAYQYGMSANALLRREAVHTDLVPRFRKLRDTGEDQVEEAVQLLNDLVAAEVELENILGIGRKKTYPPEKSISTGNVIQLAEQHAQDLRDWLGLGSGPIADIFTLIDQDLGIRLYQRRLSSKSTVSGLFVYNSEVGACILLNANHPLQRRIQSAAHELGHFIGTRNTPEVLERNESFRSRDERYAHAFGRAFLMPKKNFENSFSQIIAGASKLMRRHVILLAHQYNISREACVWRLEELGLVNKGTWAWFEKNGGITDKQAQKVLGDMAYRPDPAKDDAKLNVPHRVALMAYTAWKQLLLSEGQLSRLLKLDRIDLRRMLIHFELEEEDTDDLLTLPRR